MTRRTAFRNQAAKTELSVNGMVRIREKRYIVRKNSGVFIPMRDLRSSLPTAGDELDYQRIQEINDYQENIYKLFGSLGLKK